MKCALLQGIAVVKPEAPMKLIASSSEVHGSVGLKLTRLIVISWTEEVVDERQFGNELVSRRTRGLIAKAGDE